nr:methyl-accepting chemotaxis protein [Lysinibacillus timonensis]
MVELIKQTNSTLKRQFTTRMLIVLLIILSCSAVFQYMYLSMKIDSDVATEAFKVSKSIEQGILETQAATEAIELQLDLRLKSIAQRINDRLGDKDLDSITDEELVALKEEFNIAGITLLSDQGEGIKGVRSTDPLDIGFNFKEYLGEESPSYKMIFNLMHGKDVQAPFKTYIDEDSIMLPIAPSGSHNDKPTFFKYGYYLPENKDYIINPFFEANEVYQFTQKVGPNTWIESVLESNKYVEEIAVLTPKVYADPSVLDIKTELWKKVEYGNFQSETDRDQEILISLADNLQRISYIVEQDGHTYYKMFIPIEDGRVIYVGLDYDLLSEPLKNMSYILLGFSLLSLVALFILSTRFFSKIYKNIQVIISQIKTLESGDFTTQSNVKDKGELADLSTSANRMTNTLNSVLKDTTKQAEKVQMLSADLKVEASESAEKVYEISIDLTSKAREDAFEIMDFLDMLEEKLQLMPKTEDVEVVLTKVEHVRTLTNNRAQSTTDITITLSDLIKSLQSQSVELSEISHTLFKNMDKFKLK